MRALPRRGDLAVFLMLDERLETLFACASGLGMDSKNQVDAGRIDVRPIASVELSLGQFVQDNSHGSRAAQCPPHRDRQPVGLLGRHARGNVLMLQLHELLAYLGRKAVTTLLIFGQKGLFTIASASGDLDLSHLADNVHLFRYYEHNGEVRQAISAFKRRGGPHERTIRDLHLGSTGIASARNCVSPAVC
jgi:circadian clock protein KaiC